jgi:hypothetical protein
VALIVQHVVAGLPDRNVEFVFPFQPHFTGGSNENPSATIRPSQQARGARDRAGWRAGIMLLSRGGPIFRIREGHHEDVIG